VKGRQASPSGAASLRLSVSPSLASFPIASLRQRLKPFKLHWYPTVGSTNSKAIELRQAKKLFAPAIVLTARQTAGRGRGTNRWHAPPGVLTVTFAIPASDQIDPHHVPLIAGLAVRDACAELGAPEVGLKWPNDLWHEDRKLAGLLCERIDGVDLIGVGLNVTLNADEFPPMLRAKITSLEIASGLTAQREGEAPAERADARFERRRSRIRKGSAGASPSHVHDRGHTTNDRSSAKSAGSHLTSPASGGGTGRAASTRASALTPTAALLAIARHLDRLLVKHERSVPSLLQRYAEHLVLTGRRVRVTDPIDSTSVVGECAGIDRIGRLVLTIDGTKRAFATGGVSLATP
jgi:biotin-(acetyl-CoA carboxylase) ligase